MLVDAASKIVASIRDAAAGAVDCPDLLRRLCAVTATYLSCDRVSISFLKNGSPLHGSWGEELAPDSGSVTVLEHRDGLLQFDGYTISEPLFVNDLGRSRAHPGLLAALRQFETRSYAVIPIISDLRVTGWIECHFRRNYHRWRKEDVFVLHQIGEYTALYVERAVAAPVPTPQQMPVPAEESLYRRRLVEARQQYGRVLEYGKLLIIRTNAKLVVTDVLGNTEEILGVSPGELMNDFSVWSTFLPGRDYRALLRKLRESEAQGAQISEEVRVVNRKTREVRWLLVSGGPLFSPDRSFLGWEGFAVDITERHAIGQQLVSQSKRVEALYEIARSLHATMEPSVVALRGLRSLIKATGSDNGVACLVDPLSGAIELVASEGFAAADLDALEHVLPNHPLLRPALKDGEGTRVDSMADLPQGSRFGDLYFLKSALVVPLIEDGTIRGAVLLFSRRDRRFTDEDLHLTTVAAGQICFVLAQAEYYANERRQSDALAFLYRLSHALSQHSSPREIAEHAFPIIQEEIACKRMWLGIFNEQQSHIVGVAGVGPGMRRHVVRMQVELELRHDFLDDAIRKKQPIIVRAGQRVECSGLNRIIQKLRPGTFVIVPLVSLGQVVGILVLEPAISTPQFAQRKLPLLSSLANEIASVMLARKFESKIADAEKMRMAGLFASGVAHNFNNLLQAVMGQASLIELQVPEGSPAIKSAKMIVDAASRGASLISQLMSFSTQSNVERKNFSVHRALSESVDLYRSLVGVEFDFQLDLDSEAVEVFGDWSQLQRVVTNLLVNAKEALAGRSDGEVRIVTRRVRVRSGEVDPELSPGFYLRIDVIDNGSGMDAEMQARCFEPFFTTKYFDSGTGVGYSGSGLGLSSAYSIVRQHDGVITVRSAEGRGAMFSIYLPVSRPVVQETNSVPVHRASVGVTPVEDATVLLYGVEPLIASSIASSLATSEISSRLIEDKREIFHGVRARPERDVLLVVDADKEERGTLELVKGVRQENIRAKIVVSCIDGRRWSGLLGSLGSMHDIEVIEKTLGVWAIQSTVKRMLGVRNRDRGLRSTLAAERDPDASASPVAGEGGRAEEGGDESEVLR